MGFGFKKRPLFSPRAVTAPIRLNPIEDETVEIRTGPNSIRYVPRSVAAVTPPIITPKKDGYGLTYKELKKIKREQRRAAVHIDYIDGEPYINDSIGFNHKPAYSWSPTRWSTWNFSSFYHVDVDDDSTLFVKEPESYITPNVSQISSRSNYRITEDVRTIKELARVCYFKMIDDKDYVASDYKENDGYKMDFDVWNKKKAMYDNVYDTFVPGFTPLEQAIAILHKVKDMEAEQLRAKSHGRSTFVKTNFQFRRNDYSDPHLNMQMDMTPFNTTYQLAILNKISIIGDMGNQFKVVKTIGEKEVSNSDVVRKKPMRSYDQIQNIDIYQKLLPHYKIKFLTKDLLVNVPVKVSEHKQKIIILIDYSGSMNQTDKQVWVNALLADRFRYVMKGEAEVFVSFYNSYPSGLHFHHIKDERTVKNFWKEFSNYPSGGYTNVGRIVEYVAKEIKVGRLHNLKVDLSQELPEILIINDGQDEVGVDAFPYKVNAINLLEFSDELKNLCIATGGKQVKITESNEITAYSSDGKEIIA